MSDDNAIDGAGVESGAVEGVGAQETPAQPSGTGSLLSGNMEASKAVDVDTPATAAAPEADYELSVPEGIYTPEQVSAAKEQFKALGLGKEAAQKLMDTAVGNQQQAMEQHQQQVRRWADEVRMDSEMGGPALEATLMEAKSALGKFDKEGKVLGMLEQTGYANHPEVLRFLSSIGKSMGEDGVVTGKETVAEKPLWDRLYPS